MKYVRFLLSLTVLSLLLMQCGGNPEKEGDELYAQGKYKQAIVKFAEAKKAQPQNTTAEEKIALCYMQIGHQLFTRTKNIQSFIGNAKKAQDYLPEEGSPEFNKEYSKLLYILAASYRDAKPDNEIQRDQYFTATLDNLELALSYDKTNTEAEALLSEIKAANFQKMFDKGMALYKNAKKEKNDNLYLSAEFYLNRASSFDDENQDVKKQLSLVRKKTISIPNFNTDFPMALGNWQRKGNLFFIAFTTFNNIGIEMKFDPTKILLVDSDGNEYTLDKENTDKLEHGLSTEKTLKIDGRADCDLAYKIPKSAKIEYMSYTMENGVTVKKYFP